ncbi:MAG TPA: flagellar biosynthetic protein FliR [Polyangiales bacterium]|nr:flagellar biosynthetic protein FliR [Polyangiales bacterium]
MAHLYVLARLLPLAWALGAALIPRVLALSLALALTAAITPAGPVAGNLWLGLLRELCIGGVFALAAWLALASVPYALRLAQPLGTRAPVQPLATLYALCAAWTVLSLGGLRALVRALAESLRVLPLGGALDHSLFAWGVVKLVALALGAALGVALPIAVVAAVLDTAAGWLARTRELGPFLFVGLAMLLLVPVVMRAPELWRSALEAAQALTRTLAR